MAMPSNEVALPISPDPRPWEPLGVYLTRCALHLAVNPGALLRWLGWPWRLRPLDGLTRHVTDEQIGALARAFSLTVDQVAAMTLRRFGQLFSERAMYAYALPARAMTAACFDCLRSGWADLRWSTSLMTVCSRHQTYLHWTCPECGRPFGPDAWATPRTTESLASHGPPGRRCTGPALPPPRADLRDIHASSLAAQLLERAETDDTAAREAHAALRYVRALREADHGDGTALASDPLAPALHRADVRAAMELYRADAQAAAQHEAVERAVAAYALRLLRPTIGRPAAPWTDADPVAQALEIARTGYVASQTPVDVPARPELKVDLVPAAVPVDLVPVGLSDTIGGNVDEDSRVFLSVALAQPPGVHQWAGAAARLDLSARVARRAYVFVQQIEATGAGDALWDELDALSLVLADHSISFRARVAALEQPDATIDQQVRALAVRCSIPPLVAYRWLATHWACHPVRLLNGRLGTRSPQASCSVLDQYFGPAPWKKDILNLTEAPHAGSRRLA